MKIVCTVFILLISISISLLNANSYHPLKQQTERVDPPPVERKVPVERGGKKVTKKRLKKGKNKRFRAPKYGMRSKKKGFLAGGILCTIAFLPLAFFGMVLFPFLGFSLPLLSAALLSLVGLILFFVFYAKANRETWKSNRKRKKAIKEEARERKKARKRKAGKREKETDEKSGKKMGTLAFIFGIITYVFLGVFGLTLVLAFFMLIALNPFNPLVPLTIGAGGALLFGIFALIFGILAGKKGGIKWKAMIGLISGAIGVGLGFLYFFFFILILAL